MKNFFAKLIPFVFLGMAIVAFAFGLLLFTYLLIFGALIGLGLFAISWIRELFFTSKQIDKHKSSSGRTIDHDDR